MITFTNKKIDPANMTADDICLEDIATGLSLTCRWSGQLGVHYSVAQHCVLLARHAQETYPAYGDLAARFLLLHDASEAYLADVPHEVKLLLPAYQRLEDTLMEQVYRKYLGHEDPGPLSGTIHQLDKSMAVTEYLQIKPGADKSHLGEPHIHLDPLDVQITPWKAELAKCEFMLMAESLGVSDPEPKHQGVVYHD